MTNHFLKQNDKALGKLLKKVEQLQEFNRIFAQYVTTNIAAHCHIANIDNNSLIVIVDSGNWATQLRFHIPELLKKLRNHPELASIKSICCKTRPNPSIGDNSRKKRPSRSVKKISKYASDNMIKTAEKISDTKLKGILERIATRLQR